MEMKKKHKPQKVSKPYLTGAMIDKTTWSGALKIFLSTAVMALAFMLLCVMMTWDSMLLNIVVNSVILLAAWIIFYQTGAVSGADAVNQGEIMYARREKGRPVAAWEEKLCYHPLKGLISSLIGSIPLLVCSIILAVVAQRQMTNLGTLPSWVTPFETRTEIGNALAFYHETGAMTLEAFMRLIVRMSTMPYVNMIGATNKDAMLILERVSPLLNLIPALAYGFGYMGGVSIRANVHTNIAIGKRKAKKKQQKERRARQQQTHRGPEQLN
ncbi:MAG: hypothetical protein IJ438_10435 [Clostridia bacterium]|nr:hypothetical protein [Clostridia bacterium]